MKAVSGKTWHVELRRRQAALGPAAISG